MSDVNVSNIRTDGGTQPRASLDMFVVDDYAAAMRDGVVFPAVTVFYDGEAYWLADGFHRVHAAKQADLETINADVQQGTRRDAVLYAVGANAQHGLRRTNEDKRRSVTTLLNDPEWSQWSNREIARRCNVDHVFVGKLRDSLTGDITSERKYTTKHGTVATMDTRNIGANIPQEVRDTIRDTPIADDPKEIKRIATAYKKEPELAQAAIRAIEDSNHNNFGAALVAARQARAEAQRHRDMKNEQRAYVTKSNAVDWLRKQDKCDLLITDPPYMTDVDDVSMFAKSWLPIALSKVKSTGRAYICVGAYPQELAAYMSVSMPHQILVWEYRNTMGPLPKMGYKQNWQAILYYHFEDAPPLNGDILLDRYTVQHHAMPTSSNADKYHTWQKPDALATQIIEQATNAGDTVIDPFAGTGTFLVTAARLGRNAAGCDVSDEMLSIAGRRGCVIT